MTPSLTIIIACCYRPTNGPLVRHEGLVSWNHEGCYQVMTEPCTVYWYGDWWGAWIKAEFYADSGDWRLVSSNRQRLDPAQPVMAMGQY